MESASGRIRREFFFTLNPTLWLPPSVSIFQRLFLISSSFCFPSHSSTLHIFRLKGIRAQPPEVQHQHTCDSHMESRFRHLFAGPFIQAFPPILAFPVKFSGTWFSGMMFISNVETTYKEAERMARTIYFPYSFLTVKNLANRRKPTIYTYIFHWQQTFKKSKVWCLQERNMLLQL